MGCSVAPREGRWLSFQDSSTVDRVYLTIRRILQQLMGGFLTADSSLRYVMLLGGQRVSTRPLARGTGR